ncbi:hypothetical protein [Paraburkholderia sp. J41]|uniref:hypothetical protein n=1 Tax=Paraburkholderia sp. J41 TaxID=2805433 RepID=UPI002AC34951|nr:hypothetical protein [Paraburkholderia sp. J41]
MHLIDDEIAHITRAVAPALSNGIAPTVLPYDYWYRRLCALMDAPQVTPVQFRTIDTLMLELEAIQATIAADAVEAIAA